MDNLKEKFNTYTDAELNEILNAVSEIQNQRRDEKKNQLLQNFREAYLALKNANISIYHYGERIWNFDEFEFD